MHSIPDPVLGAHRFGGGVEHVLGWNLDCVEFFCQLRDDASHLVDLGATRIPLAAFFHPPARLQDKGVEQDDPEFGIRFAAAGEDVVIVCSPFFSIEARALLDLAVVDADEHTQEIRLHVDHVRLPA